MVAKNLEAQAKRVAAERARRLAHGLPEEDRQRVLAFADELEAHAVALEANPITVPPVAEERMAPPQQQAEQPQLAQLQEPDGKPEDS